MVFEWFYLDVSVILVAFLVAFEYWFGSGS